MWKGNATLQRSCPARDAALPYETGLKTVKGPACGYVRLGLYKRTV